MKTTETYEFPFPESVGGGSITLREPTTRIEIDAERAARGGGETKFGAEILKRCLVAVDGTEINWATADPDTVLDSLGPKKRALAAMAFRSAFAPTQKEAADFLAGMKVTSKTATSTGSSASPSSS